jgi:hypothetical protein
MNPIELFKHIILIKKPEKQKDKRCRLAENSRKSIQRLDTEHRASLEQSIKTDIQSGKILSSGASFYQTQKVLYSKAINLPFQNQLME